jgi:SAM-dependent methyltransferase
MRLNLGCGFSPLPQFVNVDREERCRPDVVWDLERAPWPWKDNCIDEIWAIHTLEHLGQTPAQWLAIVGEIYRVLRPDGRLVAVVPHPRHVNFLHDPTHVRAVTPIGLAMFDQQRNLNDLNAGGRETKLGLMTGVDLELLGVELELEEPWRTLAREGNISREALEADLRLKNNVCAEVKMVLRAVKPGRGDGWAGGR